MTTVSTRSQKTTVVDRLGKVLIVEAFFDKRMVDILINPTQVSPWFRVRKGIKKSVCITAEEIAIGRDTMCLRSGDSAGVDTNGGVLREKAPFTKEEAKAALREIRRPNFQEVIEEPSHRSPVWSGRIDGSLHKLLCKKVAHWRGEL